jgi:putative holliday junction resolvase
LRYTPRQLLSPETSTKRSLEDRTVLGRVLAIDIGSKRVGLAISDEMRLSVRTLQALPRTPWKRLLGSLADLCEKFDVRSIVLGLPLRLDGSEGDAAAETRRIARNLELSLKIPLFLQDERLTSKTAEASLKARGLDVAEIADKVDGEAALIILSDFLAGQTNDNTQPDTAQKQL